MILVKQKSARCDVKKVKRIKYELYSKLYILDQSFNKEVK